jgi:hypothetical protein
VVAVRPVARAMQRKRAADRAGVAVPGDRGKRSRVRKGGIACGGGGRQLAVKAGGGASSGGGRRGEDDR